MKKEKEYGQMKIVSLDGSTVYKHCLHLFGLSGLTVLKNGKVDVDRFRGVLDESLDTLRLEQLCKEKKKELPFPFMEQGCTRALVNVRFDHAVKLFEQYGRRYVRYGYSVSDEDMNDHVCVRYENGCPVLVAIEVPYDKDKSYSPVESPMGKSLLGKYFEYDEKARSYRRTVKEIPSQVKKNEIREYLYKHGFDIDGVHYVRYKRSAGSSRQGHCLFIAECLYKDMMQWSRCGLNTDNVLDQASWQSYIALTLSSIEKTIKLPKKAILVLPDDVSRFVTKAVCVEETKSGNLVSSEKETEVENILWDGEALLDVSVFEENGYADNGMMLLRNRFFKTCAFNTNLQAFFKVNGIEKISQLKDYTVARKVEDIKLVVTENSLKFMKFLPEGISRKEGYVAWLNALYEGKDTSLFGVVKTDKEPSVMNGYMAYANYQLLNTVYKAADMGNSAAEYILGKELLSKNPDKAKEYLLSSASKNNPQSMYLLGKVLLDEGKNAEALKWLDVSARLDLWNMTQVGLLYYYALGERERGVELLITAASDGYSSAKKALQAIEDGGDAQILCQCLWLFAYVSDIIEEETDKQTVRYDAVDSKLRREIAQKKHGGPVIRM